MDERSAGFDALRQVVENCRFGQYENYDPRVYLTEDTLPVRSRNSEWWTEEERKKAIAFIDSLESNAPIPVPDLAFIRDPYLLELPYLLFQWEEISLRYKCGGDIEVIERPVVFNMASFAIKFS